MVKIEERERQIRQLEDPFTYLSGHLPDIVKFGKKPFRLKEFIKHQKGKKNFKDRDTLAISWTILHLEELIEKQKRIILEKDLSIEEAEKLMDRIKGLQRARVLLSEMLEGEDLKPIEADEEADLEDLRRWIDYSKKIG